MARAAGESEPSERIVPVTALHGDTIAALSTAIGRSATALIRVSGRRAVPIVESLLRAELPLGRSVGVRAVFPAPPRTNRTDVPGVPLAGSSRRGRSDLEGHISVEDQQQPATGAHNRSETPIDRALVTVFRAPASYTGEDVVEISVHGGIMVPALVMEQLILAGAREAHPGEFTKRAFLNGKLDLLQVESVGDLIDATTRGGAAAAMRHLDGNLSRRILALRDAVIRIEALVAYDIDFPEEDDGPVDRRQVTRECAECIKLLQTLLATARAGELIRHGALVVIAGAPNAGKSSLFNALVGRERALVTDIPGTTRDAIEAVVDINPWTLRLVDTAGLRDTTETVERLGIEVALDYLAEATLVLICADSRDGLLTSLTSVSKVSSAPIIAALTKSDLREHHSQFAEWAREQGRGLGVPLEEVVEVSARSGAGLSELVSTLRESVGEIGGDPDTNAPLLLRARHQRAVQEAAEELGSFLNAYLEEEIPVSVAATHLRSAVIALESLIGSVNVEDVLDKLFSTFCIGK